MDSQMDPEYAWQVDLEDFHLNYWTKERPEDLSQRGTKMIDGYGDEDVEVEEIKGKLGVFKLDLYGEHIKWVELGSMGDSTLFLSGTHSTVVSARDLQGCKEDTIYFSSLCSSSNGKLQPGVPHMEMYDRNTNQFQVIKCPWLVITDGFPNATWITPSIDYPSGKVKEGVSYCSGKGV